MATVLVVDDRASNRDLVATLMRYAGHTVVEASDGREGLAVARARRPDLVITDILMPTMDGLEFTRRLRADPDLAATSVIFFTASYRRHFAQNMAREVGASGVILKPAEPAEILATVAAVLKCPETSVPPATPKTGETKLSDLLLARPGESLDTLVDTNQRLLDIVEMSEEMASAHEVGKVLKVLCRYVREIIGARYAAVFLLSSDRNAYQLVAVKGVAEEMESRLVPRPPPTGALDALLTERMSIRARSPESPATLGLPPDQSRVSSFLGVRVVRQGVPSGVLYLVDKLGAPEFSKEDEQLAVLLANHGAMTCEAAQLLGEVRRRAGDLERSREALGESEERFRLMAAAMPQVFWIVNADWTKVFHVSPACERVWGLDIASVAASPLSWASAVHEEDRERALAAALGPDDFAEELRIVRPDGQVRWIRSQGFVVRHPDGTLRLRTGIAEDVTERRLVADQLLQSQKMEAFGQLAGGIAHDFNNVLSIMIGYAELMLDDLPPEHPSRESGMQVKRAAERGAALTRQLLAFSRQQIIVPRVLDLNVTVSDILKLLRRTIGEDIELVTHLGSDLGSVLADPAQIEQVLLNLTVNARQAMPQGGKLSIGTRNVDLAANDSAAPPDARPGPHVLLVVSDTGEGMPPEVKARIFEPFFTTKEKGKGTGLGLATVFGIVKQAGGHIACESEPGHGATFKVYLPRVDRTVDATRLAPAATEDVRGTETVLVVDDEAGVRQLAKLGLERHGYTVLAPENPDKAIELCRTHQGPIHVLLTDVVMPGMSGRELASRVGSIRPEARVLYMSGYMDDAVMRHGVISDGTTFVQKPFTPGELARKVRGVLDRR